MAVSGGKVTCALRNLAWVSFAHPARSASSFLISQAGGNFGAKPEEFHSTTKYTKGKPRPGQANTTLADFKMNSVHVPSH